MCFDVSESFACVFIVSVMIIYNAFLNKVTTCFTEQGKRAA